GLLSWSPAGTRGLHSFPTRRSSDLDVLHLGAGTGGNAALARAVDDVRLAPLDRRHGVDDGDLALDFLVVDLALDLLGDVAHAGQDRKSTRLNSSHVKTSYAVFCLKK